MPTSGDDKSLFSMDEVDSPSSAREDVVIDLSESGFLLCQI